MRNDPPVDPKKDIPFQQEFPLFMAALNGDVKKFKFFLSQGHEPLLKTTSGKSAYELAFENQSGWGRNNHNDIIRIIENDLVEKMLKQAEKDFDASLDNLMKHYPKLLSAIFFELLEGLSQMRALRRPHILKLLEYCAQFGDSKQKVHSLCWAAYEGSLRAVQALIKAGANVNDSITISIIPGVNENQPDHANGIYPDHSPLRYAAYAGHYDCINELLLAGADVFPDNDNDKLPISLAARQGHIKCVKLFIEEIKKRQESFWIPWKRTYLKEGRGLEFAVPTRSKACIELFLKEMRDTLTDNGQDVRFEDDRAVIAFCREMDFTDLEIIRLFFEKFPKQAQKLANRLLLRVAYQNDNLHARIDPLIRFAVANGASNINEALLEAVTHSSYRNADLLIRLGANVNSNATKGSNPLSTALSDHLIPMVKLLLKNGAFLLPNTIRGSHCISEDEASIMKLLEGTMTPAEEVAINFAFKAAPFRVKIFECLVKDDGKALSNLLTEAKKAFSVYDFQILLNTRNERGFTPLKEAKEIKSVKCEQVLIRAGACENAFAALAADPGVPAPAKPKLARSESQKALVTKAASNALSAKPVTPESKPLLNDNNASPTQNIFDKLETLFQEIKRKGNPADAEQLIKVCQKLIAEDEQESTISAPVELLQFPQATNPASLDLLRFPQATNSVCPELLPFTESLPDSTSLEPAEESTSLTPRQDLRRSSELMRAQGMVVSPKRTPSSQETDLLQLENLNVPEGKKEKEAILN